MSCPLIARLSGPMTQSCSLGFQAIDWERELRYPGQRRVSLNKPIRQMNMNDRWEMPAEVISYLSV